MTRFSRLLLLPLLLAAECAAQRGQSLPTLRETFHTDAALRAVSFVDARHGWAVGDRGLILATRDGGRRWDVQPTPVDCSLTGVWFVDSQRGWAVGGSTTPYTHTTRGVVLQTNDGGFSWRVLPAPELPLLRGVRMFDNTSGVAWGEPSPIGPSGLYHTNNGGRNWLSAGSVESHTWVAGAFASRDRGVLVDSLAAPCTANARGVEDQQMMPRTEPPLNAAALATNGVGWLAGAAGVLLKTEDGARTWRLPESAPREGAFQSCDWRALAMRGDKVWAAGSPGSLVLHSPDGGETWQAQPTGVTAAVHALTFIDEQHGWAVGALGTILATSDAGATWRVQRRGGGRLAALVISATSEEAPLELIAKVGAAEGYRTAAVALFAESADCCREANRFEAALAGVGAVDGELCWQFPLAPSAQDASVDALDVLLRDHRLANELGAPAVDARLEAYLAKLLAETRPDVVLTTDSAHRGLARKIEAALLRAAAGQSQPSLAALGLSPWQPKRVLRVMRNPEGAFNGLVVGDYDAQLGTSLDQWTQAWRGLLRRDPRQPPERIAWSTLAGTAAPLGGRGDPLAGLVLPRGGAERRGHALPLPGDLAALKATAEHRAAFDKLAEESVGGVDWANRAVQLTGGLDQDTGAHHLLNLAAAYRSKGRSRLAADTAYLLARRYAQQPLSEYALVELLKFYSSTETAHAARRQHDESLAGAPLANVPAQLGALPGDSEWTEALSIEDHHDRAVQLGEYARSAKPLLHALPSVRLLLNAAARDPSTMDTSAVLLKPLTGPQTPESWRRCAQMEEWLNARQSRPPKPAVTACLAAEQPLLDGVLDERCWQQNSNAAISSQDSHAVVQLAYDQRHLYLAVRCEKLPGAAYPNDHSARPRDADLSGYDRVCLRIDTDRDYQTALALTVDCRGFVSEACCGQQAWNPTWYVAQQQDQEAWTIEAAIPLEELTPYDITGKTAWAIGLDRLAPGRATASWSGSPFEDRSPDAFGVLLFEEASPGATQGAPLDEATSFPRRREPSEPSLTPGSPPARG